jgi:hypothetical protein
VSRWLGEGPGSHFFSVRWVGSYYVMPHGLWCDWTQHLCTVAPKVVKALSFKKLWGFTYNFVFSDY